MFGLVSPTTPPTMRTMTRMAMSGDICLARVSLLRKKWLSRSPPRTGRRTTVSMEWIMAVESTLRMALA